MSASSIDPPPRATKLTLAEELLYATVRLSTEDADGHTSYGTGFFWSTDVGDRRFMTSIVTNRHVIEGAVLFRVACHGAAENFIGSNGKVHQANVSLDSNQVVYHPSADLCALPFSIIMKKWEEQGLKIFYRTMNASILPTETHWNDFDALEEVVMIGYPRGIYDSANNLPIARRGITATPLNRKYEGRKEFMVDMACFPGSSGSPIFLYNRIGHVDRESGNFQLGAGRFFLLGILYAGPLITNEGRILLGKVPRIAVQSMMHLGQAIRSSALLDLDRMLLDVLRAAEEKAGKKL